MNPITFLPKKAYCINLDARRENWERAKLFWGKLLGVQRFSAVDTRPNGTLGCFESHFKLLLQFHEELITGTKIMPLSKWEDRSTYLILEDDAVPCSDFNERLAKFWPLLPEDWDVFMLGYWPVPGYQITKVNEFIYKAEKNILATHCYIVNPKFIPTLISLFEKAEHKHLDQLFRDLQEQHKVYIAMPSFSYQEGAWSDTGNCSTYYEPMLKYFKDKL